MRSPTPQGHFSRAALIAMLVMLTTTLDARAQHGGTVVRAHWPDVLYETQAGAMDRPGATIAENLLDLEVLPFVDSLSLSWWVQSPEVGPTVEWVLSWRQGEGGILDGRLVRAIPDSVALTLVDLQADVYVGETRRGTVILALDSLWLPADEFQYEFSTTAESWETVFEGASAEATREAFEQGFELRDLQILRAEFEAPAEVVAASEEVPVTRRQPRRRTIFVPDSGIWIGWDLGPSPYGRSGRARNPNRSPRGDSGRTTASDDTRRTRGGRGSSDGTPTSGSDGGSTAEPRTADGASRGDGRTSNGDSGQGGRGLSLPKLGDDDEDDNDRELLGPALGAAAAVGALAYFGGTVGLYGSADAPIGLQAGRIGERGGVLLHAAISPEVASGGAGEQLVVGFSGAFRSPVSNVHPTIGLDVWLSELGDEVSAKPVLTAGLLVRAGTVSFTAGSDLSRGRPFVGVAYSFR